MKKTLFFIVALAAVAIGCTKSEVVKTNGRGREVKFDTYVGKTPVTKAESADLAYLQRALADEGGFQVYAFLHNYIEPTQAPGSGDVYNGEDTYVDVSSILTTSAYMNKVANWVGPETVIDPESGAEITKNGYWDYPGVVYWPDYSTQRKLAFAAYALNAQHLMTFADANTSTGKSFTDFTFTVPDAISDQKDLLVTPFLPNQGLSETANATPVQLDFKHLLTRVGFQVVANQDGDVEIDIQEVILRGKFPKQGTVDLTGSGLITPITSDGAQFADTYTLFPNEDHFVTKSSTVPTNIFANRLVSSKTEITGEEDANTETTTTESTDDSNRFMMIMPSTQATTGTADAEGNVTYEGGLPGAYIEVHYQLTEADPQKARVSLDGWNFAAGKSYNFIFKVSTSAIEFEVEVKDWTDYFAPSTDGGNTTYPNGNGIYTLTPIIE